MFSAAQGQGLWRTWMSRMLSFIALTGLSIFFHTAHAQKASTQFPSTYLQILHTNDIHSYFDHAHLNPERGGYARLRSLMDQEEERMLDKNIPTLRVDAGDFSEGNIFYMSQEGLKSFELHHELGYDIAILGNHDYLMGTRSLNQILGIVDPTYHLLTANMQVDSRYEHINRHLRDYQIYNFGGKTVAFIGLTTNEFFYTWRLYHGSISDPIDKGVELSRYLKEEKGVDFVVAVTHIGLVKDRQLARQAPWIDLIIGGHSHDALSRPVWVKPEGRDDLKTPIVQSGKHGENLGRLLIDFSSDRLSIIDYSLLPVINHQMDRSIASMVEESEKDLKRLYGEQWLYHIVGYSGINSQNYEGQRIWSAFVTDGMLEASESDIAIHQPLMVGPNFPTGPITRRDLLQAHPRFFELDEHFGWKMYETTFRGAFVRAGLQLSMNFGLPLSISGVSYDLYQDSNGRFKARNVRIDGRRINPFRRYRVALPEGIVRGGQAISPYTDWLLRHAEESPHYIVETIEDKLKSEGGRVDDDYLDRRDRRHRREKGLSVPRFYFPGVKR